MEKMNKDELQLMALKLDDDSLLNLCLSNKEFNKRICEDDNFWRLRLLEKYPSTLEYKDVISWKEYYLKVVFYVDKLDREHNFTFTKGNPFFLYQTISEKIMNGTMQYKMLQLGYEDLALYMANTIKKAFNMSFYYLNTPAWERYKKGLISTYSKKNIF